MHDYEIDEVARLEARASRIWDAEMQTGSYPGHWAEAIKEMHQADRRLDLIIAHEWMFNQ